MRQMHFLPQFQKKYFQIFGKMEPDELDVMEEREWRRMEAKSFKEGFRQELVSFLKP